MNKFEFIGRVGNDLELKYTDKNIAVVSLSIATTFSFKDEHGEWQKGTDWNKVTAYRKNAEILHKYVKKGDQIYITGKISNSKYTDAKNIERYVTNLTVNEFEFLGGKKEQGNTQVNEGNRSVDDVISSAVPKPDNGFDPADDDLPF